MKLFLDRNKTLLPRIDVIFALTRVMIFLVLCWQTAFADYSAEDLLEAGERGFTVQRLINLRDGYDAKTDVLPKKMFKAAKEGMRAGKVPPFAEMIKDYYDVRGWDAGGQPTDDTLSRLGLASSENQ